MGGVKEQAATLATLRAARCGAVERILAPADAVLGPLAALPRLPRAAYLIDLRVSRAAVAFYTIYDGAVQSLGGQNDELHELLGVVGRPRERVPWRFAFELRRLLAFVGLELDTRDKRSHGRLVGAAVLQPADERHERM